MILRDGYQIGVAFTLPNPFNIKIISVTPIGYDGRGPIDETTMDNIAVVTKDPKALFDVTNATLVVAYDPQVYSSLVGSLNVNQLITFTFPDSSTLAIRGYINEFRPNELTEGNRPTANITIVSTNHTGSPNFVEVFPAYTAP